MREGAWPLCLSIPEETWPLCLLVWVKEVRLKWLSLKEGGVASVLVNPSDEDVTSVPISLKERSVACVFFSPSEGGMAFHSLKIELLSYWTENIILKALNRIKSYRSLHQMYLPYIRSLIMYQDSHLIISEEIQAHSKCVALLTKLRKGFMTNDLRISVT